MNEHLRPYPEPEARPFKNWCEDLGLDGTPEPNMKNRLTYDEFCFMPNVVYRKVSSGNLYNWWKQYGDRWGECRTVEEWINDFNWDLSELEKEDLKDLNLFLGHDEFYEWSSGKLSMHTKKTPGILGWIKRQMS